MRQELVILTFVTASVAMAGCFGGGSGVDGVGDDFDCRNVPVDLFVTGTMSGSVPIYRLNQPDSNGNPREMRVVAMGFQMGSASPTTNLENGESGLVVPNPIIRVKECDTVTLTVTNANDLPHTFHMHGGLQKWTDDGVPFLSELPIHKGESRTYVFENLKAGTYWYHCHVDVAHHIDLGMYGAFIVEERQPTYPYDGDFVLMLDEWDNCHIHGGLNPTANREVGGYPAGDADCQGRQFQDYYGGGGPLGPMTNPVCTDPNIPQAIKDQFNCEHGDPPPTRSEREWYYANFPPYTPVYNSFTINGKAFPDTAPIFFEEGKTYKIRLINVGEQWHSMHLHGHNYLITHRDGYEDPAPQRADTISIGPGERYDLLVKADNPGFWAFHDHVALNVMNDHQAPGGMSTLVAYLGDFAKSVGFEPTPGMKAIEILDFTKAYHEANGHGNHEASKLPKQKMVLDKDPLGNLQYRYA